MKFLIGYFTCVFLVSFNGMSSSFAATPGEFDPKAKMNVLDPNQLVVKDECHQNKYSIEYKGTPVYGESYSQGKKIDPNSLQTLCARDIAEIKKIILAASSHGKMVNVGVGHGIDVVSENQESIASVEIRSLKKKVISLTHKLAACEQNAKIQSSVNEDSLIKNIEEIERNIDLLEKNSKTTTVK